MEVFSGSRIRDLLPTLGLMGALVLLLLSVFAAPAARADGSPDISASVSSSSTLLGNPVQVRVTAHNPNGQPYGYNLSFRAVLPEGVTYEGGGPVAPQQLADAPNTGETTLIFENVSDLSPGSTKEISFDLAYDDAIYDAGDSFPVKVQAFVNEDARFIPKFNAEGIPQGPEADSFTGYTPEVTGTQTLKAIEVEISEPSPEGEILRGVHEHQTVYTLKVTNNGVNPTTGTKLDAYIPAGLEFLGCGGASVDNTTSSPSNEGGANPAEEYEGSGPITVEPLAGCVEPESVETELVDPDGPSGPMPEAVYTHVVFPVGELNDEETKTFPYRAAVPLRANTDDFPTRPSAASGDQATNLDNNGGDEVVDETLLRTYAVASGTYQGATPSPATDSEILDRTAEDWVVHKSANTGTLAQKEITTWTLRFETSEYKFVDDAIVTDMLPDGLCPLGDENFTSENDVPDAECDPVAGQEPSADYASAAENEDGTWTLTWDKTTLAKLGHTEISDDFTITFPTKTRTHYQEDEDPTTAVLSHDRVDNTVTTEGSGLARCTAPGTPDCSTPGPKIYGNDGPTIVDASHAEQVAGAPTIKKEVAVSGSNCQTATYTDGVPHYSPGDRVCWLVRVDFPGTLDTSAEALADYLPEGTEYVPGSDEAGPNNNVETVINEANAGDGLLTWTITGSTVPAGGEVFERFISTIAKPLGEPADGDLTGNLFKFASENTKDESFPQRDEAEYVLDVPELDLVKGVQSINGQPAGEGNPPNTDGGKVKEGDFVEYRIDVTNSGEEPAVKVAVSDLLEDGIVCEDVIAVSHAGGCIAPAGEQVDWSFEGPLAPGATETFSYVVAIPGGVEPGKRIDDTAGIVSYQSETNTGGFFTYVPNDNIDPNAPTPNAPAAKDPSYVETPAAAFTKTAVTSVDENGNNLLIQATIGETITYTSKFVQPAGTTIYGGEFSDHLEAGRYEFISANATLNGGPLPGASSTVVDPAGGLEAFLPAAYTNPAGSGDDVFEFTLVARVADVAANSRVAPKHTLTNTAHFDWESEDSTAHEEVASVGTEIVEPLISQTKTDDVNPNRVDPGDVVTYTVRTTNSTATRVSLAHDVEIVDTIPLGLTPVGPAPGNAPLADGAEVPGSGGAIWDADTRTISKTVPTLARGASAQIVYRAEVDKPAIAGSTLTNEVKSTTASLAEASTGRRTSGTGYEATAKDTVKIGGATITKKATPAEATIGESVTYELTATIPANVELFDTTVFDTLPDGIKFDRYVSEECLSGCPLANPINRYSQIHPGDGTIKTAWDLGDIPALSQPQVIKFTYVGYVAATTFFGEEVVAGQSFVNTAEIDSNRTDKREFVEFDVPFPTEFDDRSEPAKATVTVAEPEVSVSKEIKVGDGAFSAGPTPAHSDDALAYRITAENSGDSPAYDVEVTDTPDPALTNVQFVPQAGVTVLDPWTAADPDMTWRIDGPISAGGGKATLEYTADFVAASALHDGQEVPNTAKIPHYFGVPKATRDANPSHTYRNYENGGEDSTEAVLDFPTLELEKTTGLSGNPDTGDAEIGQEFPWRIVVTNTSPTAGAKDVSVHDVLPNNWKYVSGSTTLTPGGAMEPVANQVGEGEQLGWTIPAIGPEESVVIAFRATPQTDAIDDPGTGAEANVNTAVVLAAKDEAGNTENEEGPYETGPDTAIATLVVPQLTIEKTPDAGSAVAGKESSFGITIENTGDAPARNLDVEDVLPAGLSYTALSATANPATGFSETSVAAGPGTGETTVHWAIASLADGDSVTITVPVTVGKNVAKETTLTNSANVSSDELPDPVEDEGSLLVGAEADMSIEKTGAATYTAGDEYTWQLRVRNLGPSDAQNVVVTDPLPSGTTFVSADTPCTHASGEVECALGTVEAGFDQTYDVTVEVDPSTETSPLDNTAEVETETGDPVSTNDKSTFGPDPSPLADVWVEKSVDQETILRKQEATFTMVVGNDGPSTARDVELKDVLPAGLEFVSTEEPPCAQAGGTVACSLGDMIPGAELTVKVTVKGTVNGEHDNKATVETTTPEPSGHKPNEDEATVIVGPVADLAIEKTAPATVAADGLLTWTLKATNNGEDPATEVTITDPLPSGVVFRSADTGCTEAGGTVTCAVGDLAVGESTERQITVTVPRALADTTVLNTASVKGKEGDDVPPNDEDEAATKVGPSVDVSVVKTGPGRVNANGTMTWTLAVANAGPSTATGVTVKDVLPAGVELKAVTPSQGSCSAGATIECQLGTLANGAAAQIQIVAHVPAAMEGATLVNKATVGAEEPDYDPKNDESGTSTVVDAPARTDYDLSIVKTVNGSDTPNLLDTVRYTLAVTNRGPATATGVKVIDTLPASLEYVSASLPGGKCSAAASVVTCRIASLKAGAEARATVTVRVMETGTARNTASVSADVADADPNNNSSNAKVRAVLGATKLKVTKKRLGKGTVEAGDRVRYLIEVRNLTGDLAADVVVCDRLPGKMSFAALSGASLKGGEACWEIDILRGRATKTFRLTARVDGGVSAGITRNVAYAKADNAPKRRGVAGVRVENSGPGRGGGVTG